MGKPSARATTTRVVSGMINKSWDVSRSVSQCGIRRTRFFASREVGVRRSVGVAGARKRKQRPVKEEGRRRVYERLLIFATHVSPFYRAFFPPARPPARADTADGHSFSTNTRTHHSRASRAIAVIAVDARDGALICDAGDRFYVHERQDESSRSRLRRFPGYLYFFITSAF